MSFSKIKIGLIQFKAENSPAHNLLKAVHLVRQAGKRGAQIICLPELFKSHYFPQRKSQKHFGWAESIPGPTSKLFASLACELKTVLIVPIFEQAEKNHYYNSLIVINANGAILGKYRKTHLPNDPGFYEQYYFDKGNLGFEVFHTTYGTIGALICWDQWFPEAARALAVSGAQIIFYPTAIGWHQNQNAKERQKEKTAWEIIQRSHAISNGVFVASVNRVGREGKLNFWGNSFVTGLFGEMLAQASQTKEEILMATCKLSQIKQIRKVWPFLKERRTDAYYVIARRRSEKGRSNPRTRLLRRPSDSSQ